MANDDDDNADEDDDGDDDGDDDDDQLNRNHDRLNPNLRIEGAPNCRTIEKSCETAKMQPSQTRPWILNTGPLNCTGIIPVFPKIPHVATY